MLRKWMIKAVCLLFIPLTTFAGTLGVYGSLYPIAEPDMLEQIYQKLSLMQSQGQVQQMQRQITQNTMAHILRPPPVAGVTDLNPGVAPKQFHFNPSITANRDITDNEGYTIVPLGQRYNPLSTIIWDDALVFINADNPQQVAWAKQLLAVKAKTPIHTARIDNQHILNLAHRRIQIVLVKGDIKQAFNALHTHIYFDQQGRLCRQLHITHTPSVVYQAETSGQPAHVLTIQEVSVG